MNLLAVFLITITIVSASNTQNCTLSCRNGGICKLGHPDFGYAADMNEDDPSGYSDRAPTYDNMHCQCPVGYSGLKCEIALVICEEKQSLCSNGSPCEVAQDDLGGMFRHCECDGSKSDMSAAYALHFCQQTTKVFCTKDRSVGRSFCSNGGSCREIVSASEAHKGCDCKSTWEGPHCQFFKSNAIPLSAATSQASASNSNSTSFAILGAFCALVVVALVGFLVWRSYKRKKAEENELHKGMGEYNDKATEDGSAYSGELKTISGHII